MKRIIAFIFLLTSTQAFAEDRFVISGIGTVSCGKFLEHQGNVSLKNTQLSWMQGFLSGMNIADSDATGRPLVLLPDIETIAVYLVNHCSKNPLDTAALGAIELYKEIRSRQK